MKSCTSFKSRSFGHYSAHCISSFSTNGCFIQNAKAMYFSKTAVAKCSQFATEVNAEIWTLYVQDGNNRVGVKQAEHFPLGRPHIFFIFSSIQWSEVGRGLIQIKWPPPQSQRLTPEKKEKKETLISLKAALGESDEGDHDRRPVLYCRFRLASYLWHRHTLVRACTHTLLGTRFQWLDGFSV